jgi:hypothetical protein
MLYDLDDNQIRDIPKKRKKEYRIWRSRLADEDFERIKAAIDAAVGGNEIAVSSFIPGKDWRPTPYQPIFEACGRNEQHAAFFFGLIMWQVMIERDEAWYFKPADKEADDILGMTYFRKKD